MLTTVLLATAIAFAAALVAAAVVVWRRPLAEQPVPEADRAAR